MYNLNGATYYEMSLALSDFWGYEAVCGNQMYFAIHMNVFRELSNGSVQHETAWGEGTCMVARGSWAMYQAYTLVCETVEPDDDELVCETAYAYGDISFVSSGLGNKWGWVVSIDAEGSYEIPLYAGAGNNIISNGQHAGNLVVNYFNGVMTVDFVMFNGFVMDATHVYASWMFPTTSAPGQYGNQHDLNAASSDSYSFSFVGSEPVYLIAHAVVCY